MPYAEKCDVPEQELCYFSLISQCNDLIDSIGRKTTFIQKMSLPTDACEKPSVGSPLEERLKGLVSNLETLNNSFKL